jgi:hypothetical protein
MTAAARLTGRGRRVQEAVVSTQDEVRAKYDLLKPYLRGRTRRLWAAAEAAMIGRGGIVCVSAATGICTATISRGVRELKDPSAWIERPPVRAFTTGRPRVERNDPGIIGALERMLGDETAGDPMTDQKWARSSLRKLQARLREEGHLASPSTIARLLRDLGYSPKACKRRRAGDQCPGRDEQFEHIRAHRHRFLSERLPVISVDTKKKELIGNFRNQGRAWCRESEEVNEYDFPSGAACLAVPYGIYDLGTNTGYVVVGISHNTPEFAATAISRWWENEGRAAHPRARELMICADGGGGNANRSRAWKFNLQEKVSDRFGLRLTVCHYPSGCSKWNPVEYRLFSQISLNWAGRPLRSLPIMLAYIQGTTTAAGLTVRAELDEGTYRKGQRVMKEDMERLNLQHHEVNPQWNYTISPRPHGAEEV